MGKIIDMADWIRPRPRSAHPASLPESLVDQAKPTDLAAVRLPSNDELDPLRAAGLLFDRWGILHFASGYSAAERQTLSSLTEAEAELTLRAWQSLREGES